MTGDKEALKLRRAKADGMREATDILDDAAQEWNRKRDPGMANQARSYAATIRTKADLIEEGEA